MASWALPSFKSFLRFGRSSTRNPPPALVVYKPLPMGAGS
jgi:hypothetical protein